MIRASQDFLNAMLSPIKELWIKLEFYTNTMSFIESFEKYITAEDIGSISVDINRPVRRSFNFSLSNIDGKFNWGEDKLIWMNKRVKLYVGLKLPSGTVEYVPQGVYILTEPADSHNLDGKMATLTAVDKMFLMTDKRGKFINSTTIATGTSITGAIKTIAEGAGETLFNFDPGITTVTPYELTYEPGTNRYQAIKELAEFAQCQIYYDVYGYLRLKKIDLNEFEQYSPVWTYKYNDPTDRFYAGNIRKLDETELSNHIIVLGGSGQTAVARYELIVDENDPLWIGSPYSIQQIGDIVYGHNNFNPDGLLTTNDECKWRAKWELMKRLSYTERLSMNIAPNYLHEGGDIIEIEDSENNVSGKYLLVGFNLPLNPDLMTCEVLKYRKIINDWNFI